MAAVGGFLSLALLVGGQLVPAGLFALGGYLASDFYGDAHNGDDADDDQCEFHMAVSLFGRSLNTLKTSSLSGKTITQAVRKISMKSVQKPMCS